MKVFLGLLIFFLAFGWSVLLLTSVGLFYTGTVLLSIAAGIAFSIYFLPKISHILAPKLGKIFILVLLISLLVSIATCFFATPTVFGGRDQGAIATAAIQLSKNHNLTIAYPVAGDLFQKYKEGRALNFPGFNYKKDGTLVSRFPVGYTAYLAAHFDLIGLKGIQYANAIPLFFFLAIFWLILREFFDGKVAFFGFLAAATFFPFLWFAKYSLTETYMLFLVWAGIYFLLSLRGAQRRSNLEFDTQYTGSPRSLRSLAMTEWIFWLSLAAFGLSALVRIEGIIFFFLALAYIFLMQKKKIFPNPKNFRKHLLVASLILAAVYLLLNYVTLSDSLKNIGKAFLPDSTKDSVPSTGLYEYLGRVFFNYNLLTYVVMGLGGIFWALLSARKKSNEPESESNISRLATLLARNDSLAILFVTFPAFVYLLSPQITLDDPWMLRRFVFAVFPLLIFFSIYALSRFFRHKVFLYFAFFILIATNLVVTERFFTQSENKKLLSLVREYAEKTGPNDLILVDRLVSGSGYSLISEPLTSLFDRQSVYFFNPYDFKYVDQDRYEKIYLFASLEEEEPWYIDLIKDKQQTGIDIVKNNFLEPSEKKWGLAQNIEAETLIGIWQIK